MTKTKTKTFITTYRGSITDIATIARWLVSNGITPRSKSELINIAVTNFVIHLDSTYPELTVLDERDALTYLSELNILKTGLAKMQPALSKNFWDSGLETNPMPACEETLASRNKSAQATKLAADALELMQKATERNQEPTADLSRPANLTIAKDS